MSTITLALPDDLDAMLAERIRAAGAESKEAYLLTLVESDCAAGALEETLSARLNGPFAPLEEDWKERVRQSAIGVAETGDGPLRHRDLDFLAGTWIEDFVCDQVLAEQRTINAEMGK